MIILSIRTDKPVAEIGLYEDDKQLEYLTWEAHRQLGLTLHQKIKDLLSSQQKDWIDIEGVIVYKGPGSFTGLRIGLSVANALAYSYKLPMAGATGEDWQKTAINKLLAGEGEKQVMPFYGGEAHITLPKK